MAEDGVSIAMGGSPSDHEKKRKLEDLGTNAPEPLNSVDSDSKAEPEKEENAEEADESELKRPRLEDNENNNGQLDGLVAATENGYQERENVDKSEQPEEQKFDEQPVAEEDSVLEDDSGQEKPPKVLSSAEEEQLATGDQQRGDNEEPSGENEKPKTENEEEASKVEVQVPFTDVTQDGSNSQTISRKMEVPNNKVGVLIGKAGDTIRYLQYNSGAKIQIMRDADSDPRSATRPVELIGTLDSINKAEKLINDVIAEADAGGSPSLVARGFSTVQAVVGDQVEIQVPNEKVGLIIGKGGETIKNLQTRSGARIQLVPQHLPAGDQSKERTVRVTGDRKQIELARDLIKEVMNQNVRPSPLSGGYSQQAFRPRGPVTPQWGNRGPHPTQFMGYDYQQRGPYPSQNPQYPPPSYGNYPPPQAQRSSFGGPSWDQRPPSAMHGPPQGNYNYGQPHNQEYGQPAPFHQAPVQSYGQGYNEMKYDNQVPAQHPYGGHGVSQQTGYPQGGGAHPGYGAQDQYGRPTSYGMHPQAPHGQSYGQPRPAQPGEMPYQAPATQAYGSSVPTQQSYPYASGGPIQQGYPPYGSAPPTDGYSHPQPASATAPGYPQQGGPPVSGYGQTGVQQPSAYSTGGPTTGYGSYPSQPGYAEQPAVANTGYGYQASADAAYGAGTGATAYGAGAPTGPQSGYVQPTPTQPGYDQANAQSAGYGAPAPVPAPTAYGKSASPQPGYPQYDSSQMYGAPR